MSDLSLEQQQALLVLARNTLANDLGIDYQSPEYDYSDEIFKEQRGVFVTLHKNNNLRGCIGYITGFKNLYDSIKDMVRAAAFQDPRFPSVMPGEFSSLEIEISVLTPIAQVKDTDEITVGRDGLIITGEGRSGLLLPQVAVEQSWNREQFLEHTCLKAGLPPNAWKKPDTKIEKFSAQVFGEKDFHEL